MKRVMIFIDGSNLYHEADRFSQGMRVDFDALRKIIAETSGGELIRTFYYTSIPANSTDKQKSFLKRLGYLGFKVKTKVLRQVFDNETKERSSIEKGVDVQLAVDLVKYGITDCYDVAIVVSGDEDFCPAVEAVQERGKVVKAVFFQHAMAEGLKLTVDSVEFIDGWAHKISVGGKTLQPARADFRGSKKQPPSDYSDVHEADFGAVERRVLGVTGPLGFDNTGSSELANPPITPSDEQVRGDGH